MNPARMLRIPGVIIYQSWLSWLDLQDDLPDIEMRVREAFLVESMTQSWVSWRG